VPERPLVLASRSPQRERILRDLGLELEIAPADVQELAAGDPREAALENARRKARAVAGVRPGKTVLGADTVVALDGRILPKPVGPEQAASFLRELSGRTHDVFGAVCVIGPRGERTEVAASRVTFRPLAAEEVAAYVAGGEWRERAGGYAIQGRAREFVTTVTGSYSNVVGLSEELVHRLLTSP
jgi:septum formation protein